VVGRFDDERRAELLLFGGGHGGRFGPDGHWLIGCGDGRVGGFYM
jgi:hypothetical protein